MASEKPCGSPLEDLYVHPNKAMICCLNKNQSCIPSTTIIFSNLFALDGNKSNVR